MPMKTTERPRMTMTVGEALDLRDSRPEGHAYRGEADRALLRGYRRTHPFDKSPTLDKALAWAESTPEGTFT